MDKLTNKTSIMEKMAVRGTKPAPKADNIDWEQRRWELAKALFLQGQTYETSFTLSIDFIKYYKQSLNTEEQYE